MAEHFMDNVEKLKVVPYRQNNRFFLAQLSSMLGYSDRFRLSQVFLSVCEGFYNFSDISPQISKKIKRFIFQSKFS